VGGNAQIKAMKHKTVAGGLRLALASFRELEAFAQLGTDLDAETQGRLDRGYRMVELLKQGQYQPMKVSEQIIVIYAGNQGFLDQVPVREVQVWEKKFIEWLRTSRSTVIALLEDKKELTPDVIKEVEAALTAFNKTYTPAAK